jgi:hypothetical protein
MASKEEAASERTLDSRNEEKSSQQTLNADEQEEAKAPIGVGIDAEVAKTPSTLEQGEDRDRSREEEEKEKDGDVIWVDFEDGDPENPFNFSKTRKWTTTLMAVFYTMEVAATASAYVPGIPSMERDLNIINHELSLLGISLYALGFAIPPLFLAPFSEVSFRASHISEVLMLTIFNSGIRQESNLSSIASTLYCLIHRHGIRQQHRYCPHTTIYIRRTRIYWQYYGRRYNSR